MENGGVVNRDMEDWAWEVVSMLLGGHWDGFQAWCWVIWGGFEVALTCFLACGVATESTL